MKYVDCRLGGMWLSVGEFESIRVEGFEGLRVLESMSWGNVVSCWLLVLILWMRGVGFGIRVFWFERLLIASCWLLVASS